MKTFLTGVFAAIFATIALCGISLAQQPTPSTNGSAPQSQQSPATSSASGRATPPSAPQASGSPRIAPGSVIPVRLTKAVDARKLKTGEPIEAEVTQDLRAANGELIVPKDTKVVGHITETQARNKEQKESRVGIAFDHEVTNNGEDVPLPMSIQAIVAPPNPNSATSDAESESTAQTPGGVPGPGGNMRPPPSASGGNPQTGSAPSRVGTDGTTSSQAAASAQQPITAKTQGMVGISNLKLAEAADKSRGSVVSSDIGSVKLESGTLLLLRVNP